MSDFKRDPIDSADTLQAALSRLRDAQRVFATYTQDQVDAIFHAAAMAANRARIPLAHAAFDETRMGVLEDKVIKNHFASEYIYNAYKHTKTCGVIEQDAAFGVTRIAEPIGVIAAVIPTTNPTSTTIFKCLLALKTRNAMIVAPHPRAKTCTSQAVRTILEAAVNAGAPYGILDWIDEPQLELTNIAMREADLILATGGPGMVKAAYSSGKPAIGVGAGNTPAIIADSADVKLAVNSIIHSKTFDNGMICASEQSILVTPRLYNAVKAEFAARGCYLLNTEQCARVRDILVVNGDINTAVVGQSAHTVAALAGVDVPDTTKILIGEVTSVEPSEPFANEKLCPVLALYHVQTFDDALDKAERLIAHGGYGHTASLYIDPHTEPYNTTCFRERMKTCRILLNTPAAQGGVGDLYNFRLAPSLTLGCGSWGGNSVSDNVGVHHLLNIKSVLERRENMLWLRTPSKIYMKRGCLPVALEELSTVLHVKQAFLVTDSFLYHNGYLDTVTDTLNRLGIRHTVFFDVEPDPTLACANAGAAAMHTCEPDCIIAVGGGSAMDAAKIMWMLYEHPDADFHDMTMRFMDIRKRVFAFPKMGEKAAFIAVPTSSGTGSEVTPFAVITDDETHVKYPLADYELMPTMAIVDADLMMHQPKELTAAAGIDALTHALEAYGSMLATDFTDGLAIRSLQLLFNYLPRCYEHGAADPLAREKIAGAATMAGIAFANAFLGLCHSMAHKLGAFHHLPHGVANALLITEVMRFNACEAPAKMGTFPQYGYPHMLARYAALARMLGLHGDTDEAAFKALLQAVCTLKQTVGIHDSIAAYGIEEEAFLSTLDDMAAQAFDDQCTGANPRYPLISEIKDLYRRAYYGE